MTLKEIAQWFANKTDRQPEELDEYDFFVCRTVYEFYKEKMQQ
jgi:hypothetical protein